MALPLTLLLSYPSSCRFCFSTRPNSSPPLPGFIIRVSPLSAKSINGRIPNPPHLRFKTTPNSHSNQPSISVSLDKGYLDMGRDGEVFKKTLRLVECAMLASVAGLIYVLSNTLAIEVKFCYCNL